MLFTSAFFLQIINLFCCAFITFSTQKRLFTTSTRKISYVEKSVRITSRCKRLFNNKFVFFFSFRNSFLFSKIIRSFVWLKINSKKYLFRQNTDRYLLFVAPGGFFMLLLRVASPFSALHDKRNVALNPHVSCFVIVMQQKK